MKLIRIGSGDGGRYALEPLPERAGRVVALGYFDGVHIGHRRLIAKAVGEADARGLESAVFTFSDGGIKPGEPRLMSFDDRLSALGSSGVFAVFCADFSAVRELSAEEFVRDLLIGSCGARVAVCGFNFRFGSGASGDADELCRLMRKYGGEAIVLERVSVDGCAVSSTEIRRALSAGEVDRARAMLGAPFVLASEITHGARIGHTIDFPTLNQYFPANTVIPRYGVYVTECEIRGRVYQGVSNVGVRPTVGGDPCPRCETHIFGFSDEAYGETAHVSFLRFLRPETAFGSLEELCTQIERDVICAREYFENNKDR